MNLSPFQIILALLASFMILHGLIKYINHEQRQTLFKVAMTVATWGSILIFSLFPSLSRTITRDLGFGENLNTLIFLGFVMIFLVLTKIIHIIERTEKNISEIVRKEALEKINNAKK